MPHLVEIAFKGNRKEFYLWEGDDVPALKTPVVVEADRGEDLGLVHATGDLAIKRAEGVSHGPGGEPVTKLARRIATKDEFKRLEELRTQDETARRQAMERVKANGLAMKLTDAEWRWDRRKLTIYFTAERRVDFRNLVRELAAMFRTRIELKQIGVRDEAKRLSGIGRCGREYCSASWLPDLRPVNLGVAKDQRLSLNPSQISGACGRLMCCLRYEHEFYVHQRKRFPKEGRAIATAKGEEKVITNDIFRERVTLRNAEGEMRTVGLAELKREVPTNAQWWSTMPDEDTMPMMIEVVDEEVWRLQDTSERPAFVPGLRPPRRRAGDRSLPMAPPGVGGTPASGSGEHSTGGDRRSGERQGVGDRRAPAHGRPQRSSESASPPAMPNESRPGASTQGSGEPIEPSATAPGDETMTPTTEGEGDRRKRRSRRRRGRRGGRRDRGTDAAGSTPEDEANDDAVLESDEVDGADGADDAPGDE
jgi:cell fate regulator YaaT (PSP1 superfamily)